MATPNYGLIPQQTLDRATMGVVQDEISFADQICRVRTDIETLKGEAPFLTSQATVRRRENRNLQPGVNATPAQGGFGTVSYNCLRQTGFSEIYDESQISAAAYDIDLVSHWVAEAIKQTNTNADAILEEVLESTTLNLEFDCAVDGNGEWDDFANGTPLDDIDAAATEVPDFDCVVAGRGAISALRGNPQLQGRFSNYTGGAFATMDELRAGLAAHLGIDEDKVFLLQRAFYNEEAQGQGYTTAYTFNDGFWLGKQDDLQLFDPQSDENRKSEIERVASGAKYQIAHHRYVDIVRHVQENGIYFSNVLQ